MFASLRPALRGVLRTPFSQAVEDVRTLVPAFDRFVAVRNMSGPGNQYFPIEEIDFPGPVNEAHVLGTVGEYERDFGR